MNLHLIYAAAILIVIVFFLFCLHRKNKEIRATRHHLSIWMKRYNEFWEQSHVKTADEWMAINAANAGRARYLDGRARELEEENKFLRRAVNEASDRFKEFAVAAWGEPRGTFRELTKWIQEHKEQHDFSQNPR